MGRSLVSLGANIGDPLATIQQVAAELRQQIGCPADQFRLSRMFRTPPVGGPSGQPPFVNAVAAIEADIDPWELWAIVRRLEHQFGRERNLRWEARKIDLDILLCNHQKVWTPHLKIPHPRMCMRRFILVPAADVAADWTDPVTGQTIEQLASRLQTGPASLALVSSHQASALKLLEKAARLSVAVWHESAAGDFDGVSDVASRHATRWVAFVPFDELANSTVLPVAKLSVFLGEPTPTADIAWEDFHRQLAVKLNLVPAAVGALPLSMPRYLLAAEHSDWAVHELVAALEAMDCPVEAIL